MSEKTPPVLDRLWDDIPTGRPPVEDLLAAGHAVKRRRRRAALTGVVAATALIAGAAAIGTQLVGADSPGGRTDDMVAHGGRGVEAGTRLVGIGQVAVAVPEGWADNAASCNTPVEDTAFFPWPQDCAYPFTAHVSSVAITTDEFWETGPRVKTLNPVGGIDEGGVGGYGVVENQAVCASVSDGPCTQTFGIPALQAFFTVTIEGTVSDPIGQLRTIRSSLTVLPSVETAVPFVPMTPVGQVRTQLEAAGFVVEINHLTCPDLAQCFAGVRGTSPSAGTVVERGSTVTINAM